MAVCSKFTYKIIGWLMTRDKQVCNITKPLTLSYTLNLSNGGLVKQILTFRNIVQKYVNPKIKYSHHKYKTISFLQSSFDFKITFLRLAFQPRRCHPLKRL